MNISRANFLLVSVIASLLLFGSCSTRQSDVTTAKAAEIPIAAGDDPEVGRAIALINKLPDSPMGYDELAILFIKRARQTGNFPLNEKAVSSINKALEISPNDENSRKLKASVLMGMKMQLTAFDKFPENIETENGQHQSDAEFQRAFGTFADLKV